MLPPFGETSAAETFDPNTGEWTIVSAMGVARADHALVAMPNSTQVMAAGGTHDSVSVASTEFYDESLDSWNPGPPMNEERFGHSVDVLSSLTPPSSDIVVVGGNRIDAITGLWLPSATAEYFDGASWHLVPAPLIGPRAYHATAVLSDDTHRHRLVVVGGVDESNPDLFQYPIPTPVYDHDTKLFLPVSGILNQPRAEPRVIVLNNDNVLAAGGYIGPTPGSFQALPTVEFFDPAAMTWNVANPMAISRADFNLARLPDTTVIACGGLANLNSTSSVQSSAEIFSPLPSYSACQSNGECASGSCVGGQCAFALKSVKCPVGTSEVSWSYDSRAELSQDPNTPRVVSDWPHYNNNITDIRGVLANKFVTRFGVRVDNFLTEADYDFLYYGGTQTGAEAGSLMGIVLPGWRDFATGVGHSFQSAPGYLSFDTDFGTSYPGFVLGRARVSCDVTSNGDGISVLENGKRYTGALLGTDDVVYAKVPVQCNGPHQTLAMWTPTASDFDLYVSCNQKPAPGSIAFASTHYGSPNGSSEFIHATTQTCVCDSNGMAYWYVAVHSFAGARAV